MLQYRAILHKKPNHADEDKWIRCWNFLVFAPLEHQIRQEGIDTNNNNKDVVYEVEHYD